MTTFTNSPWVWTAIALSNYYAWQAFGKTLISDTDNTWKVVSVCDYSKPTFIFNEGK